MNLEKALEVIAKALDSITAQRQAIHLIDQAWEVIESYIKENENETTKKTR